MKREGVAGSGARAECGRRVARRSGAELGRAVGRGTQSRAVLGAASPSQCSVTRAERALQTRGPADPRHRPDGLGPGRSRLSIKRDPEAQGTGCWNGEVGTGAPSRRRNANVSPA